MYDAPGIGLAAPQVGILRRLIVMDPSRDEEPKTAAYHGQPGDPRAGKRDAHARGRLPVDPGLHRRDRAAGRDPRRASSTGKESRRRQTLEGIWSTLVQHEIDHLNGVLFIDYLSRLKRDMIVKKFTKQKRADAL